MNSQPIPSYKGYDYVSEVLASHGYVVVSISANGVNAVDNSVRDLGALARAELIQKHLDILKTFNTTGGAPFGTKFVGKFDMTTRRRRSGATLRSQ
jgi:predicted dienelactone hydrolase